MSCVDVSDPVAEDPVAGEEEIAVIEQVGFGMKGCFLSPTLFFKGVTLDGVTEFSLTMDESLDLIEKANVYSIEDLNGCIVVVVNRGAHKEYVRYHDQQGVASRR